MLDSKDKLTDSINNDICEWVNYLPEPLVLTGPTEIYLESIYIGGYKVNGGTSGIFQFPWEPTLDPTRFGYIYYFSIGIPEFQIKSIQTEYNSPTDLSNNGVGPDPSGNYLYGNKNSPHMGGRFNLCQTKALIATSIPPNTNPENANPQKDETKPFILGHLSKESVFVSKINPQTLTKITVNIQDQDGRSIFTKGGEGREGNPYSITRRIFLKFLLVEKSV